MPKFTLLEIVQDILNDMDSDEVNSIDDTIEAQQVAAIVSSTFNDMMANRNWSHQLKLTTLNSSTNSELPTVMYLKDGVKEVCSIYYNKAKEKDVDNGEYKKEYREVKYVSYDNFLRLCNNRNSFASNIFEMQYGGTTLLIQNDKHPDFYTSFNDKELIFDSWDKEIDDVLQSSKTQLTAYFMPTLVVANDAIPDLPEEAFPALINEAKSRAMLRLKQFNDHKAETESRRQNRWLANKEGNIRGFINYPDYGRKGRR